jgi:anaerobic selenocysteine-containing dehydrogenase
LNARDVLRETGTTGLQCPVSYEDGALHQTVRYHDAAAGRGFSTPTGKANFVTSRWSLVEDRQAELEPQGEELWIINRRTSMNWSAMVEDNRIPFRVDQLPVCPLELHPDDAQARGIEDGQPVVVQTDGTSTVIEPFSLGTSGRFEAVAVVTDRVRKGVACAYFNYGGEPATAANNAVSNSTEAITNKQSFKLGRGRVLPA